VTNPNDRPLALNVADAPTLEVLRALPPLYTEAGPVAFTHEPRHVMWALFCSNTVGVSVVPTCLGDRLP
jgi:hypothetical protein